MQLRQGQERLEQEWMTLLKKEQARWEEKPQQEKPQPVNDVSEITVQDKQRVNELTRAEKEQLELKAELERLRKARQSALQEIMDRTEPAAGGRQQPEQEDNAPKLYRTAPMKPPILLDGAKAPVEDEEKVDIEFEALPPQLEISSLRDDSYRQDKVILSSRNKEMAEKADKSAKPNLVDEDANESPFGKLTPDERRRMLESMQERAKNNFGGKPKRRR